MPSIEKDLQDLSNLQKEIKILSARKIATERDLEAIEKKCVTLEKDTLKELTQLRQKQEEELQNRKVELDGIWKDLNKRDKELITREKEAKNIEQMQKDLQAQSQATQEEFKSLDTQRASLAEKEHKANLLIEQYEKKLAELEELTNKK